MQTRMDIIIVAAAVFAGIDTTLASDADCRNLTGVTCRQCNPGFILKYDKTALSIIRNCDPCPRSCSSCDSGLDCDACKEGYFGDYCDVGCHHCKNFRCDHNLNSKLCYEGCNEGYYEYLSGNCYRCPSDCISCVAANNCTQCKEGSYGDKCLGDCNRCKDGLCDEDRCTDGCASGYFATSPDFCFKCDSSCLTCTKRQECQSCNEGFYLDTNTSRCLTCPRYCFNCSSASQCDTCKDGWYGPACEFTRDRRYCGYDQCEVCRYETGSFLKCEQCKEGERCTADDDSDPGVPAAGPGPLSTASVGVVALLLVLWKFA